MLLMKKIPLASGKKLLLSCSLSLLLISCGGGGSSEPNKATPSPTPTPTPTPTYKDITVIDGYIRGAIAFIDLNENKILDDNEPWVETGPSGFGQIDTTSLGLPPENIKVIVNVPPGAVDESTINDENPDGVAITEDTAFQMLSLPGENVATPLTTLVSMSVEENGDIEAAKAKVAESLGITVDDVSTDYLKAENEELTVLTELIIANKVIPQDLTTEITPAQLLVATTVSSQISEVVQEANKNGVLADNSEAINAVAQATTAAVIGFVGENSATLNDESGNDFVAIIEQINQTSYDSFEQLLTSTETVTEEDITHATQQANVMSGVIVDLLVDNINTEAGISESTIADAEIIIEVINSVVNDLRESNTEGVIVTELLTEIAAIAAQEATEQLVELKESGLTEAEIVASLEVAGTETAQNLEKAAEGGIALDDLDGDGIANETDTDIDGDGVLNESDAFKYNATETLDTDLDGIGDNSDPDIDGDSVLNKDDAFDYNATESVDTDLDGIGDNSDPDIDGDGVLNESDAFKYNAAETLDTDLDGIGNNSDTDIDADGYLNADDAFELDATEWVDSDNDTIGNNTDLDDNGDGYNDTAYKTVTQTKDGLVEGAQDFVVSADGKFMYIGSHNGLMIVTLDENGKATENIELVTPTDLGSRWPSSSFYLDFSPNGQLYWAMEVEIDYVATMVMMVFDVDIETGSVAKSQMVPFEASSGIAVRQPEIFKFSSDGKFLYVTMHYGDAKNELLIYGVKDDNGDISYITNYDLDTFGDPDYEHNFDISGDNKYLYYGYTNYDSSPSSPALAVMKLDTEKGFVTDSWVQNFEIESNGLSFVTSKVSDIAYMAAGGQFMVLEGEGNGGFSIASQVIYDTSKPASFSLTMNNDESSVIVFSSNGNTNKNRVDHFTIAENNTLTHNALKTELSELSLSVHFSGNDNKVNWLGYQNDILFSYDLTTGSTDETTFGSKYLDGLSGTKINDMSTLSLNNQGATVKITDLGNEQGLTVNHYEQPELIGTLRSKIILDDSTLLFTTIDYNTGNSRTTYVTASIPNEGVALSNPVTRFLGNGDELYRIYSSQQVPGKNQLLAFEKSVNTNQEYGYTLYTIGSDHSLTFVSTLISESGYVSLSNLTFNTKGFNVGGKDFSLINDEIAVVGEQLNDPNQFIYAKEGAFAYSSAEYQLTSYVNNSETGELTKVAAEELPDPWRLTKISDDQFLMTSLNKHKNITLKLVQVNEDGTLTYLSTSSVTTTSDTRFYVNTYPVENSDVVWLFVQGGFYDVIKVELAADTDSDGDGIFDNVDLFDLDASETIDLDQDGIGDNSDTDRDGDGTLNDDDAFPENRFEWLDTDGDGLGNNTDSDIDGDSYLNDEDIFPLDSTEWIDTDGDGIGNNVDTDDNGDGVLDSAITLMAYDKDGLIDNAQDFTFSDDGRFMYVGGTNGLLIITMGDDGQATDDVQLVPASALGLDAIPNTTYLDFSSDGKLYWALNASKDDLKGGALMVLTVDSTEGSVVTTQLTYLTDISEVQVNSVEIFTFSSDNSFLYATAHYGDSGDNLLVYTIDADTGHLTYSSAYALDHGPDYEHNFDISNDDQYLYYGYSEGIAKVQILTLDQTSGGVSSSMTQEFVDYNSQGMSLLTSKASNKAYIAADEHFITLNITSDGSLSVDKTISYNIPGSVVMAMDMNATEDKFVIESGINSNYKIDYLTIDDSDITHHFGNSNLDDMSLDIHLNNEGDRVTWIGWDNDIVNNIDLTEQETINQQTYGAKGLDNLTNFHVNNNSVLAFTNRGNVVNIEDLGSGLGLNINSFPKLSLSSDYVHSSVLLSDTKVMFFTDDFVNNVRRTQYTIAETPNTGSELVDIKTYYLGDGIERYTVYRSILLPENRLLTFERSDYFGTQLGLSLYQIEDDDQLTLISSLDTAEGNYDPTRQWKNIIVNGLNIHLDGNSYTYENNVLAVKESEFTNLTEFVFSADNAYVYSIEAIDDENDKIVTYTHNDATGALIEVDSEALIGHWNLSLLDNQKLLLVSNNIDKMISVHLVDISNGHDTIVISTITVPTATDVESGVNVRSFENTVWLFVTGGYFDVFKLRID